MKDGCGAPDSVLHEQFCEFLPPLRKGAEDGSWLGPVDRMFNPFMCGSSASGSVRHKGLRQTHAGVDVRVAATMSQ